MKRFIISILCVAVFFVGLGTLVENAGAKFKSDEKALTLIRQARQAIGGDAAIASVRSMTIEGKTTRTIKSNGGETVNVGGTEIALELPNKLMKMVRVGSPDGSGSGEALKQFDVVIVRGDKDSQTIEGGEGGGAKKIVIEKGDGTTEEINGDGEHKIFVRKTAGGDHQTASTEPGDKKRVLINKMHSAEERGALRQNELFRTTLSLLLSAPEGIDVSYTFGGETDIDGIACNLVNAEVGGSTVKLFLSKASSLPVMMSYTGHMTPMTFKMRTKAPDGGEPAKDVMILSRGENGPVGEPTEFQVRFAEYRSVSGVQLPYKWTTTVGSSTTEVFDVTAYDLNPANIGEKFQKQKQIIRVKAAENR